MNGSGNFILLVEDNPDDVTITLRAFQKNNITNPIVVARDGEEALEYIFGTGRFAGRDIQQKPVIILLDIKLPKIDGLEVLRRIREDKRTALLPVVILTSSDEELDIVRGYTLGVNSYVRKPVNFDEFLKVIGLLGMYWVITNETA